MARKVCATSGVYLFIIIKQQTREKSLALYIDLAKPKSGATLIFQGMGLGVRMYGQSCGNQNF